MPVSSAFNRSARPSCWTVREPQLGSVRRHHFFHHRYSCRDYNRTSDRERERDCGCRFREEEAEVRGTGRIGRRAQEVNCASLQRPVWQALH